MRRFLCTVFLFTLFNLKGMFFTYALYSDTCNIIYSGQAEDLQVKIGQLTAHRLPLTDYRSLLTAHCLPLTAYC
ncbi:MAG: hypothetical protein IPI23_15305 [Bacteroidetes bacterium]|nr:hypothetical protein [Bacteroidota bacterium]MBK9424608.1 hypothetical protein [Bacteroidota bacterium]